MAPACAAADAAAGGAQHPAAVADIAGEMTHAGADAAAVGDPTPAGAAAAGAPASAAEAAAAGPASASGAADSAAEAAACAAEAAAAGPASASGAADSAAEAAACAGGRWQWVDVALAAAPPDSEAGSHGHGDSWDADASAGSNRMSITMQNVYHYAEGTPLNALTEHSTCTTSHKCACTQVQMATHMCQWYVYWLLLNLQTLTDRHGAHQTVTMDMTAE